MTEMNRSASEWRDLDRARADALAALVARDPARAEAIAARALAVGRRLWRAAGRDEAGLRQLNAAAYLASLHGTLERMLHHT